MKLVFVVRLFLILIVTTVVLSAQEQGAVSLVPSLAMEASSAALATSNASTASSSTQDALSADGMICPHDEKMILPPEIHGSLRSYSSVAVDGPYLAISFDDGPSPSLTPRLLKILKQRGIRATFFVIGKNVERAPEIVARAAAEGHEIGNHTWSHPVLTKLSDLQAQEEITKTSEVIFKATGKKPALLRPPYGAVNPRISRLVEQDGMKVVLWSVDPNDWKRPGSAVVESRIVAGAKPGAIILSHDIHPGTIEAMPSTLDALLAKGYKFVTISELIAMESKKPQVVTPAKRQVSSVHKNSFARGI